MDFAKIRPRGGTKVQWEKANPVLAKREIGVQWETTIGVGEVVIKIGDGVTDWINLPAAVKSDITKKIIAALAVVPDDDPDLADGDSLDTLFGKIAKKFKYLKDNKLDKSARYDGTDSTSTELVPTANALRGVNAKADKNASDITTLNNNLSKCNIGYSYDETDGTNDIYTAIPNGSIVWFNINGNTKIGQELGLSQQYEGAEIIIWKGSDWRGGALAIGGDGSPVMIGQNNGSNSIKWNPLVLKSDLLNLSRTFVSGDSFSDAKDLSIPPGIYGVNPGLKNIPENTYGLLEVTADTVNNWRFLKFTPTNIKSHYLMFYNGYDKTWSEWAHFASTT